MTETTPDPQITSTPAKVFIAVVVILALVLLFAASKSLFGGDGEDGDSMDNQYEAISQCEARIDRLLKSPSTAEYNSSATGAGTWAVTGTVDAQNSFGAMTRANFRCTVVMNGDGTATTTVDSFDG